MSGAYTGDWYFPDLYWPEAFYYWPQYTVAPPPAPTTTEPYAYAPSAVPSKFQTLGLNIAIFRPQISPDAPYYDPRGQLMRDDIATVVSSYAHEISANGGFTSATITLEGDQVDVEWWISNAIGKHVEVYDEGHQIVWEGFVNSYRATVGSLSVSGGPLMDVANQVVVVYTPVDTTADPPATGPETETTAAVDSESQSRYGILETVYSGGQTTQTGAEQIRDTLLEDSKYPARSETLSIGGASGASITLECAGYYDWLDKYIFNDTTAGVSYLTDKMQLVLEADPNEIFGVEYADFSHIEENQFLVVARERDNKTAMTVIKELVAIGDANDRRTFFGVYERRVPHYYTIPQSVKYEHRIADSSQRVDIFGGGVMLRPWQIRPGDWVFLPDFLSAKAVSYGTDIRNDPRVIFIESVKYSMPYGVTLNGNRYATLPQLLAKRGMIGGL